MDRDFLYLVFPGLKDFDPNQPRDESGKWTSTSGGKKIIRAWHGTPGGEFEKFDPSKFGSRSQSPHAQAFFLTTSQPRAEAYSGRAEQQLYDAYVEAFGNPPKAVKRPNSVEMEYMVDIGKFKPHKGSPTADDIKKAMEEGYEGIISNYGDRDEMELAVFTNKPLKRIKEVVV